MAKQVESAQLFENPLLEKFTKIPFWGPLVIFFPIVSYHFWQAWAVHDLGWNRTWVLGTSGLFAWTLTEYFMHRVFFHYKPRTAWGQRLLYIMHENHHDVPNDPLRLVLPPVASLSFYMLFSYGFKSLLGPVDVNPFLGGFIFGYLVYDYTHYAVHHFRPRTWIGRSLKNHHMLHHFATPDKRYGVSSPFWDWVFRTLPEPKAPSTTESQSSRLK